MRAAGLERLEDGLASDFLRERLASSAADFVAADGCMQLPRGSELRRGLAALLASQPRAAGFLARRSSLRSRLAQLDDTWLERRARELARTDSADAELALEGFLDEIRLLQREDTLLAACLDLSGAVPFSKISRFLSELAECIVRRALRVAEASRPAGPSAPLTVLAMGKLAGREFTYHSDLDLIFLTPGGADAVESASRIAQRLVGYLSTMTGAGVAYSVDSRLRPSGHQGMLVTTFAGFERYQLEQAQLWEHLALMRARVIAGGIREGQALLERTRAAILARLDSPWDAIADLRRRVHAERGQEDLSTVAFKAGVGGIMDVEFLACGSVLERGEGVPEPPAVAAMLQAAAPGAATDALLGRYAFLRELEARVRLVADRAEAGLDPGSEAFRVVCALLAPEQPVRSLLERLAEVRHEIAAATERVIDASSIEALIR